ncbi:AAC(3) family N-acetyltransferase [Streptomyces sp. NBC_01361]|uniref:AAC(3) family N-acetyltransferase n=1 Tax=Streptomyces sp. NBC_01361 TaxID=2903838 RepID=UPI002E328CEB|nr:AAC(3) family N-acetyltransferase [Streptomyces sp. NBC_01361]
MTEVDVSADGFDELGADFERDGAVVRGRVGGADALLFPVADAVAYAQGWLARHRA